MSFLRLCSALAPAEPNALILGERGTVCLCLMSRAAAPSRNAFERRAAASSSICFARLRSSRCLPSPGTTSATDAPSAETGFGFDRTNAPELGWNVHASSSRNSFSFRASCSTISFSRRYSRMRLVMPSDAE